MTLKDIYKAQLEYVKAIAEDIKRNNCSEEVIKYASKYVQVENDYGLFWRVNFGEAYAYVDIDEKGNLIGNAVGYVMDEIGCESATYNNLMRELDNMSEEHLTKTEFAWCYDDVLSKGEYHLEYKPFEN